MAFPSFRMDAPLRIEVPEPWCPALREMRRPPRWQMVWSVANLDSFTNYIAYYATPAEREELLQLPVVYHRGNWDHLATRIPLGVMVRQRWTALPEADCTAAVCVRCEEGHSGYSFYWVDERWTPEGAIDMTQTLQELREEAERPWPRGILREPQPALAPGPFLTSEWDRPSSVWER